MAQLADYLKSQIEAGVLAIDDVEIAAAQLMESYQAKLFKPMVFNFAPAPSPEQIERVVRIAVKTFLAAYRAPAKILAERLLRTRRSDRRIPAPAGGISNSCISAVLPCQKNL